MYGEDKVASVTESYCSTISEIEITGVWRDRVFVIPTDGADNAQRVATKFISIIKSKNSFRAVRIPVKGCMCLDKTLEPVDYELAINMFRLFSNKMEIYTVYSSTIYISRPLVTSTAIINGGFLNTCETKIFYFVACAIQNINLFQPITYSKATGIALCIVAKFPERLVESAIKSDIGPIVVYSTIACHKELYSFDTDICRFVTWLYRTASSEDIKLITSPDLSESVLKYTAYIQNMIYNDKSIFTNQICCTVSAPKKLSLSLDPSVAKTIANNVVEKLLESKNIPIIKEDYLKCY